MQPVAERVKLQVCNGSSCKTMANLGVRRSLCLIIWPAIFADSAKGNRIVVFLDLSYLFDRDYCGSGLNRSGVSGRGIRLEETAYSWQQEVEGRHAFRAVNASATRYEQ